MSPNAIALNEIEARLAEYLKKLGLDVEQANRGVLEATRRTSLAQEAFKFKVVEAPPARITRNVTYILPDDSPAALDGVDNVYRYSDFLDRTIQADVLCRQILDDDEIQRDRSYFVPQHIDVNGEPQTPDAQRYVLQWLSGTQGGLLVVLAPAGYGKTVLTRVIAERLADIHVTDSSTPAPPFPFLLPFGEFRRVASFESMILQALHHRGITDVKANAFAHLVQHQRCVLLLDGFDELLEERPEEAQKNLRELIETLHGDSRVMITARSTFFRTSTDVADFLEHGIPAEDVTIVDLRPFDAGQRAELVQKLSPDQTTIRYVNQILELDGVREAMGSPLLLRETIEALKDSNVRTKLTTKTRRSGLFKVLEASVYERERQRHGHLFSDRVQDRLVERAAEEMLRGNVRGFDRESIDVLALEAAADYGFEAPESDFAQLADHHFFVVDHSSSEVRFNHQVFREYFQAKAIVGACSDGGSMWVTEVLSARPLPEEVARFLAETDRGDNVFTAICRGVGLVTSSGGYLVANLSELCQAFRSRQAVECLFESVDRSVSLDLQLENVDLSGLDLGERMFDRLQLVDCDLQGARFGNAVIRELSTSNCRFRDASFGPGVPESLQIDFGPREFEPIKIQSALRALGVVGLDFGEKEEEALELSWRDRAREILVSRLRRFVSGRVGQAVLWDQSISEQNLFGGLAQVERHTVSQIIVPEMTRQGVLTRHREHNLIVYRLTDAAKDDARALVIGGAEQGRIREVLDAIAPNRITA